MAKIQVLWRGSTHVQPWCHHARPAKTS